MVAREERSCGEMPTRGAHIQTARGRGRRTPRSMDARASTHAGHVGSFTSGVASVGSLSLSVKGNLGIPGGYSSAVLTGIPSCSHCRGCLVKLAAEELTVKTRINLSLCGRPENGLLDRWTSSQNVLGRVHFCPAGFRWQNRQILETHFCPQCVFQS